MTLALYPDMHTIAYEGAYCQREIDSLEVRDLTHIDFTILWLCPGIMMPELILKCLRWN